MSFLSTSAKTGDNVEEAFVTLARSILQAGHGKPSAQGATSHRLHVSFFFFFVAHDVMSLCFLFTAASTCDFFVYMICMVRICCAASLVVLFFSCVYVKMCMHVFIHRAFCMSAFVLGTDGGSSLHLGWWCNSVYNSTPSLSPPPSFPAPTPPDPPPVPSLSINLKPCLHLPRHTCHPQGKPHPQGSQDCC